MSTIDELAKLHTAHVDARNGYAEASKDCQDMRLKAVFDDMTGFHEAAHASLHRALTAAGASPDEGGSFMSTVHETVISVRAATVGLNEGSLSSFASGEERILARYDDAIQEARDDAALKTTLTKQRSTLAGKIEEMKAMAA